MTHWTTSDLKRHTQKESMKTIQKQPKYRNIKKEVDGIVFDSKKEAGRYLQLKAMQNAGLISDLKYKKSECTYPISIKDKLICKYIPDFIYVRDSELIIEDAKGIKTAVYRLKKKLMKAIHGIEIKEV